MAASAVSARPSPSRVAIRIYKYPQKCLKAFHPVMLRSADALHPTLFPFMHTWTRLSLIFIYQSPQYDYLITRELPILPAPQVLVAATEYDSYSPGIVNRPHAEGASRGLGLRHESAQALTTVVPISAESSMQASGGTPYSFFLQNLVMDAILCSTPVNH